MPSIILVEAFRRCSAGAGGFVRAASCERAARDFPDRNDGEDALPERPGGLARFQQAPLLCAGPEAIRARPHGDLCVPEGSEEQRLQEIAVWEEVGCEWGKQCTHG